MYLLQSSRIVFIDILSGHTRELRYQNDPTTGLTHAALSGIRNQSVMDAERLLSFQVSDFIHLNHLDSEAEYVYTVARRHEATDRRGLTEETRSRYNKAMIYYLVSYWAPWINLNNNDYSLIDIGGRRSPAVACWASSNPLRGKFRHYFCLIIPGVCLAQFSLNNVHKKGLKHHHFISLIDINRYDKCLYLKKTILSVIIYYYYTI